MLRLTFSKKYPGLWDLKWNHESVFGNTYPFGFYIGFKKTRLLICILRHPQHGRFRLGWWWKGKQGLL